MANKMYYPNRLFGDTPEQAQKRERFFLTVKNIRDTAISCDGWWSGSYYVTRYITETDVWEYIEDAEYGIPYSLEKIS